MRKTLLITTIVLCLFVGSFSVSRAEPQLFITTMALDECKDYSITGIPSVFTVCFENMFFAGGIWFATYYIYNNGSLYDVKQLVNNQASEETGLYPGFYFSYPYLQIFSASDSKHLLTNKIYLPFSRK